MIYFMYTADGARFLQAQSFIALCIYCVLVSRIYIHWLRLLGPFWIVGWEVVWAFPEIYTFVIRGDFI